jgi:FG-GAP-like repeat
MSVPRSPSIPAAEPTPVLRRSDARCVTASPKIARVTRSGLSLSAVVVGAACAAAVLSPGMASATAAGHFLPGNAWTGGPYYGSRGTFFADVTGDGKADAIAVNDDTIKPAAVWVRPSDGSQFLGLPTVANQAWTEGAYYGSRGTFFADVTGDGKADAIAVNDDVIIDDVITVRASA